ncbi:DUF3617 domain-containing protein [Halomonas rhizosphaerae]|uniref:DUF3617 domain-containing protein n=1 Tax=Halomonas rhizosphaerae TaxID=3043296 RepID=A0ABT6V4L2_9GAMM|nr:DUF3617 domain-containing protein [Halomonas rhizosphaerae]MDI5893181.1 DUF3617 domain-containing protein [Halomonas rhizosphaerae]
MSFRPLLAGLLFALPLAAVAESPNIEPGQWEFTSNTFVQGDLPIPDQTETHQECIAQGDIDDEEFSFIHEEEGCELLEHEVTVDGLDYRMVCRAEGGEADIIGRMDFLGERVEGNVDILVDSPVGEMKMTTTMEGRRIGDC